MDPQWVQFGLSALGVVGAGLFIGRVAGELGERLRLGRAWAGAVLVAFATTLPELVATLTVALRGEIGIAIGCILGSVIFNLVVLVFADCFDQTSFYPRVSRHHLATGLLGCALLGLLIVGLGMGYADLGGPRGIRVGHVGVFSLAMLAVYGVGQYALFRLARRSYGKEEAARATPWSHLSAGSIVLIYLVLMAVILVSAYNLGVAVDGLEERYRLGATFAGVTLLGIVTSLPELTNGLTCAKQREFDLVVGNILGANALVFVALVLADLGVVRGPIFHLLSRTEALSSMTIAGVALIMQGVVLAAVAKRSTLRVGRLSLASFLLAGLFITSLAIARHFAA